MMKLDDLKQDWQESITTPTTATDLTKVIAALETQTTKINKEVKRRDMLEISIALLLIPVWLYGLFISAGVLQSTGYFIAILSCLFIPYRLIKAKKVKAPKDTSIKAFLQNEQQKILQQKLLLESIVSWYIAPLTVSIILITLGGTVDSKGIPHLNYSLIIYYSFLTLLVLGIYFLNKRAAKKKFTPLLAKINQQLLEIGQH
ncbi:hypothetical protein [Thalassotalea sp. G2M2-11]|uniref:hypothetical protein n=1 Tax=Thalassotalea sp. G2M2-11 TaxID=2787627 RepID=UPI0019D1423F|nr:hypothetical protein [Thalassotalea sp. G2M2-11]